LKKKKQRSSTSR